MNATAVDTTARLQSLREAMSKHKVDAYIVPSEDAHQSEYIAPADGRRAFISGFTGSAGVAVVTAGAAALWTDGRYFLQASKQLDHNWTLMKAGQPGVLKRPEWIIQNTQQNANVAIDPWLCSQRDGRELQAALDRAMRTFFPLNINLVDLVWGAQRPARIFRPIVAHDVKYAGESSASKLAIIRADLAALPPDNKGQPAALVLTALDDIAWLFNLRGTDIPFNPLFFSYAYIPVAVDESPVLYIAGDVATAASATLSATLPPGTIVREYADVLSDIVARVAALPPGGAVCIDDRCNWALSQDLVSQTSVRTVPVNPVTLRKAVKNPVQLAGFRACHLRDAAALVGYFAWLEDTVGVRGERVDECDGADELERRRAVCSLFRGLSFDTISSTGPNAAVIHYKPERGSSDLRTITRDQIYLCDSGAQYLDGTTDVTRTLHMGTPTAFERRAYTRVLQGHIAVDCARFPLGTTGCSIDPLARMPLWRDSLEFRHGVGHGVGHFSNVHEGPQAIADRPGTNTQPLLAGMTVTNEPGYYHDGEFGIRIENVELVVPVGPTPEHGSPNFLKLENVTFVPLERKLIQIDLLSNIEHAWVNDYHVQCWEKVSPLLEPDSPGHKWLRKNTLPI